MFEKKIRLSFLFVLLALLSTSFIGCSSESESATRSVKQPQPSEQPGLKAEKISDASAADAKRSEGAMIRIKENSPADTVRIFYKRLREKKFRDAIVLTNLRPAIEGLTDSEIKDLGVDFGFLAKNVPEHMPINGEIITGKDATVTVRMPNEETKKPEIQEIKLRRSGNSWIVLVADEDGEKMAKKEGKNYFFALRMDVHHQEAKAMLDRIGKAQLIYSMKFGGRFTDLETLIEKGFVPEDAKDSVSTGYQYEVLLASNNATYTALATPAAYGKTGKLSFALSITRDAQPRLTSKDLKGKPLQN
jgi:hypothetical protein